MPFRRHVMEAGKWFRFVSEQSSALDWSLETGNPDAALDEDYRRFFEVHAEWSSK
jgi:hypothetical protein